MGTQSNRTPTGMGRTKIFNVYGPNEYHKGRMASVIFHSYRQINQQGYVKLFRSHKDGFKDGEQLRDFIYVKDILKVCYWLMKQRHPSAIYNLGTGKARSFTDLVHATFASMDIPRLSVLLISLKISGKNINISLKLICRN